MRKPHLLGEACAAVAIFITMSSNAALIGVLPATSGGTDWQAYYDDQLDITWTANANINGNDTWDNQMAWVADLTINGIGGWRLPNIDLDGNGTFVDCALDTQLACKEDNEYGHLFYYGAGATLGNGVTAANPGPFSNVQNSVYWSSTEVGPPANAWFFSFFSGIQVENDKTGTVFAWAVRPGDASVVPVPAAAWMFGSGLIGLLGVAKRKR